MPLVRSGGSWVRRHSAVMAGIETFFDAPSEELLERFTKAQLLQIAEHYGVAITGKKKQEVKECLIANLEKDDILQRCAQVFSPSVAKGLPPLVSIVPGLTFDQQKELMLIQLEHERMKIDKEYALEKI